MPVPKISSLLDGLSYLLLRFRRSVARNGLRVAILRSIRRLVNSLRNHGLSGTASRASREPELPFGHEPPQPTHPFDILHGTDTGGFTRNGIVQSSTSAVYTVAYYGISPSTLAQALARLPEPVEAFTFVDIGCGKGRALLIAAQLPFIHLLGIELSDELCTIARQNLTLFPTIAPRASVLHQDATTVAYPGTPLVLFLYDPFFDPILRKVLANLHRQLRSSPRPAYILYAANRYGELLSRIPYLELLWEAELPLSPEDAAVDRHALTHEHYTLYRAT